MGWTLAEGEQGKAANVARVVEALRGLVGVVPSIREFEVVTPQEGLESSFDVVLSSTFDDEAGLREYVAHPAHVAVAQLIGSLRTSRAAVDYDPSLLS